jgi:hypothetical protein
MPRLATCLALVWAFPAVSGSAFWLQSHNQSGVDAETGHHIIDRAVDRAEWIREQKPEAAYRYGITRHIRRLEGDGNLRSEETRTFEVVPLHGVSYRRLIARNGRPLSEIEQGEERKRERAFLEQIKRGQEPNPEVPEDEIKFDAHLVSRYMFTQKATESVHGRPTYRLSFEPRPGRLPIRRQIDRALNRSRGEIWIDSETYEIARVRFELIHPVRVWWGLAASINDVRGEFNRAPLSENIWMPQRLNTFLDLRVVFRSTRREETTEWKDFVRPKADE